ncbi:hypothetical protein ACH5RR_007640 [Cinchona calisaya]|uniref:Cytochrome P450 n=1 Tax=Cinchona calisaya TaxID=153742 RepID=A0ABD3AF52_9GENT
MSRIINKMEIRMEMLLALVLGALPLMGLILWFWYDIWYAIPLKLRCKADGTKLPPGYMGFPFLGEMLTFLLYFKYLRRPDDFINSKKHKYGDAGMFRTHLFGSPSIIAYSPSLNKLVLQSENLFGQKWPSIELLGYDSIIGAEGEEHVRMKRFVVGAINQPDALNRVALLVQPRVISALHSWAEKGRIVGYDEAKKLTFANIGKYFAGLEPGPELNNLSKLFTEFLKGVRAYPLKFPGTAYYRAIQVVQQFQVLVEQDLLDHYQQFVEFQGLVVQHVLDLGECHE